MAFPSVLDVTPTSQDASSATVNVALPATVVSGQLLLINLGVNDAVSVPSTPSGWSQLRNNGNGGGRSLIYAKTADGSEAGGTFTLVFGGLTDAGALVYRIGGWNGNTVATDIDISTAATATASTVNSNTVTAGWGSDDNLFLIFAEVQASAFPGTGETIANYTNYQRGLSGLAAGARVSVIAWERQLAASSDDPAASSNLGATFDSVTTTLVIKPGAESHSGSGTLAAVAGLTGSGEKTSSGSGTLSATAGLTGSGVSSRSGFATLSAVANLTASGYKPEQHSGSGTLSAAANITATGQKHALGSASISAVVTITASGEPIFSYPGYVKLRARVPVVLLSASAPSVTLQEAAPAVLLSESAPGMELSVRAPSMELRAVRSS